MVALSNLPEIKGRYDPLKVESWVLKFWKENDIPRKVRELSYSRKNAPLFRFLEGPPTANGYMHVGHARGRTFKDVILRYYRMKGYRVWDQAGWDTQGLPVEIEVERSHGFKTKKDIERYGVEKFIKECQELVDYYIDHWRKASERLGLWLNYDMAYETRHPRYVETAWRFLKTVWKKGWLYEDLRVVPVCPRCETALSSHEVAQGYKVVVDPSLYFKVKLLDEKNVYLIAWTTTPWTIISNEALAVHPEETYVKIRVGNEYWIVAKKRLNALVTEWNLREYEIVEEFKGIKLFGKKYEHPLLEEVPAHKQHTGTYHHAVLVAEWVSMEEGTGVVHIAPAHGPEDFELGKKYGLPVFKPLQKNGVFGEDAGKYASLWFKDANKYVIEDLKRKNLVVYVGSIQHEYPHCWRCDTPLMYYADKQWFIKVEPIKELLLKENDKVIWRPEWAGKRFHDWLANARDWCISRERYWGTPLPIWTCNSCGYRIAVGSLEELRKLAENPEDIVDIHRPWVDRIKIRCPKCGGIMTREPYVVDVWLDSGIAHTAALEQYEKSELFKELFPYDWITEAVDQTRGWFYTLIFTSVAWYGVSPYKKVLCQGHVLDKYGKKMSKSRGNVIWALDFMEKYGADILRLYLLSKAAPWDNINFDPDEVPEIRRILDVLWNSTNFALTYMAIDSWNTTKLSEDLKALQPEDLWILTELNNLIKDVEKFIERNELHLATRSIMEFIVEKLSHKYITLIRPRVWIEENVPEKRSAYATLYIVIKNLLKVLAPFAPYLSEYLYQAFIKRIDPRNKIESIHMEEWPRIEKELVNEDIWRAVNDMLEISERILMARSQKNIKRRWPIKKVIVVAPQDRVATLSQCINVVKVYANVKEVMIVSPEQLSKEMVRDLEIVTEKPLLTYAYLKLDEDIVLEGLARDVVRRLQVYRRDLNLPIDKVIEKVIVYTPDEQLRKAIELHRDYIREQVRVKTIEFVDREISEGRKWDIEGKTLYALIQVD